MGCLLYTSIRLGVFEVWIEVEFIIGICGQQKNDFIRIADDEFAISRVQASSFVYGLYAESKFHLVVFEATGIEQTIDVYKRQLLPIQTRMLGDLTGGMWEQNPGW